MYVSTVRVVRIIKTVIYLNLKRMLNLIRALVWIVGLRWLFTSKDAKPTRTFLGKLILISWIVMIALGGLVLLLKTS